MCALAVDYNNYLVATLIGARLTLLAGQETFSPNKVRIDAGMLLNVVSL